MLPAILKALNFALTKYTVASIISVITIVIAIFGEQTTKMEKIGNIVDAAFFILTVLTTVLSTVFICQQIKSSISETQHANRYSKIIHFVIESSAIYSFATLLHVISAVISISSADIVLVNDYDQYIAACTFFMTVSVVSFLPEN